jgi:hypothetical protein
MSTFTVFNIGTGHKRGEVNNTVADLYRRCSGSHKFINDGPTGPLGNAQGRGMDPKCRDAIAAILAARPQYLNLIGHSRGAVISHMIANDLSVCNLPEARRIIRVNMICLDPVNMSVHTERGKLLAAGVRLGSYVSIVMENVTKKIFPSTTLEPLDSQMSKLMTFLHMPGTHGSGTQPLTSAIGKACHGMIMTHLAKWGTQFDCPLPSAKELADAFARIHVDNPVQYDEKGLVKSRLISDSPGKATQPGKKTKYSWEKVGRVAEIAANYERMAADDPSKAGVNYRDSPYFFNEFHAAVFEKAFPAVYRRFTGNMLHQVAVNRELTEIETHWPMVAESLSMLGML